MKKVLIFIAGVVTGAILMLVIAALIGNSSNGESSNNGMTFFEKEGDRIMTTKLSKFLKENVQSRLGHSNTQQRQVLIRLFLL